jgi:uncharacterized membrane protein (DUF373 family)
MRANDRLLKIVNPVLFFAFLIQAATGLGMDFFEWEQVHELHEIVGPILILLIAVHLYLNRWWIKLAYGKNR